MTCLECTCNVYLFVAVLKLSFCLKPTETRCLARCNRFLRASAGAREFEGEKQMARGREMHPQVYILRVLVFHTVNEWINLEEWYLRKRGWLLTVYLASQAAIKSVFHTFWFRPRGIVLFWSFARFKALYYSSSDVSNQNDLKCEPVRCRSTIRFNKEES